MGIYRTQLREISHMKHVHRGNKQSALQGQAFFLRAVFTRKQQRLKHSLVHHVILEQRPSVHHEDVEEAPPSRENREVDRARHI